MPHSSMHIVMAEATMQVANLLNYGVFYRSHSYTEGTAFKSNLGFSTS